jgi:hypothetical protein
MVGLNLLGDMARRWIPIHRYVSLESVAPRGETQRLPSPSLNPSDSPTRRLETLTRVGQNRTKARV